MLYLNVKRILDLRGIDKPFAYLHQNGFIRSTAHKFVHGDVWEIKLEQIERLCLLLNCSPNDLFEWKPDKNTRVAENHPLKSLNKEKSAPKISQLVKDIPVDKLHRIEDLLKQLKDEE